MKAKFGLLLPCIVFFMLAPACEDNYETCWYCRTWDMAFRDPEKVTHMVVKGSNSYIPSDVGKLINMESFYGEWVSYDDLPPGFGTLPKLKTVVFYFGYSDTISSVLAQLPSLESLTFKESGLMHINDCIGDFNSLEYLYIDPRYRIETISPRIRDLKSLRVLSLSESQMESFPSVVFGIQNLRELFLTDFSLDSIPPEIGTMSKYTRLGFASNNISSIPPQIGDLRNLEGLHLQYNVITAVPEEIGLLESLVRLNLNNNQISEIPPQIGNLSKLETLDLRNNQISTLPDEIGKLKGSLKTLDLRGNPLAEGEQARLLMLLPGTWVYH